MRDEESPGPVTQASAPKAPGQLGRADARSFGGGTLSPGRLVTRVVTVNDYQKEIADLEAQIDQQVEAEGDPKTIAELLMQLEILKAIYARALDLLERGRKDQALRYGLRLQGYADWSLANVYPFVYKRPPHLHPTSPPPFLPT